ncbi:BgTH12-04394 [Blumeria graminis f. sp. triticale]|uniref:glycine--tRNA ligase n=3 Tax=Blumeria graminis TaxID=34373 RepID=A0A061HIU4_BLUGR|nr:Cytoplasmic and mitochondrial glycyl-tRNA synthase [Blumeria graminis f. sp. tritici 96224]CAD6498733.1 BgTH12-04394 [Blumeria graminis f. sp. triticale]
MCLLLRAHNCYLRLDLWRTTRTLRIFSTTTHKNRYTPPKFKIKEGPHMATTTLKGKPFDRQTFDSMLRRRMFYTPSFEIYNGVGGLFDYGPPGCALQANIVDLWRKHFVLEEDMLEVDCTALTPEEVLKTSGHVDKFADWMCKDPKNGDIIRADHFVEEILEARLKGDKEARGLLDNVKIENVKSKKKKLKGTEAVRLEDAVIQEYKEILAKIDNYDGPELGNLITKYEMKNPETGVLPSAPVAFNLMFQTTIGPSSNAPGYFRPETAQGQFVNFAKLLEFNQQQMPFASASVGKSFRNEISPRAGLLRVREFLMAEIEHYVDPEGGKKHGRFHEVKDVELVLLNRETQLAGQTDVRKLAIGAAVSNGTVDNETLGYFLARIHLFLMKIGIDKTKIRFRQHMANEMAHYATDCWDAELLTSYGWIECVGCADRSAYDLTVHAKKTGAPLMVRERLETPISVEEWQIDLNKKKFGPYFKKDGKVIEAAIEATPQCKREALAEELKAKGKIFIDVESVGTGKVEISNDLISVERRTRVENTREYTPNVIEPSFGIGRILYALLEHNYWSRGSDGGDEARCILSFPPVVAPTKVLLVPLSTHASLKPLVGKISLKLRSLGISSRIDDSSASIGKRYSRNDELGTPLGITIDFQSVKDQTFTLRDRDSTKQVRADEQTVLTAVKALVEGEKMWSDIERELPSFEGQETDLAES